MSLDVFIDLEHLFNCLVLQKYNKKSSYPNFRYLKSVNDVVKSCESLGNARYFCYVSP